jgi:hypothetical protein
LPEPEPEPTSLTQPRRSARIAALQAKAPAATRAEKDGENHPQVRRSARIAAAAKRTRETSSTRTKNAGIGASGSDKTKKTSRRTVSKAKKGLR